MVECFEGLASDIDISTTNNSHRSWKRILKAHRLTIEIKNEARKITLGPLAKPKIEAGTTRLGISRSVLFRFYKKHQRNFYFGAFVSALTESTNWCETNAQSSNPSNPYKQKKLPPHENFYPSNHPTLQTPLHRSAFKYIWLPSRPCLSSHAVQVMS